MKGEVCNNLICTGCALCTVICPVSCIEMKKKGDGFSYPEINVSKCIECNLCSRKCPSLKEIDNDLSFSPVAFCGYSTCDEIYTNAASGGAASSIALAFASKGGVVFGLKDTPGLEPQLDYSDNPSQVLKNFIGVKYFQYNFTEGDLRRICDSTKAKRTLFIGLPCQVYSVKKAVEQLGEIENFSCVDLVCQGAPSYLLVQKYREEAAKMRCSSIVRHQFRTKANPAEPYTSLIEYGNGCKIVVARRDSDFYRAFTTNLFLRESCYRCKFTKNARAGDLTLGDYRHGEMQRDSDTSAHSFSLVLLNNDKGFPLIDNLSDFLLMKCNRDEAVNSNLPLRKSVDRPLLRTLSYHLLERGSLKRTLWICDPKGNVKKPLYKILKQIDA